MDGYQLVVILASLLAIYVRESTGMHRYDGSEVWKIVPQTPVHLDFLVKLMDESDDNQLDFWKDPSGVMDPVVILVPPNRQFELRARLRMAGITTHVTITDVQEAIDRQSNTNRRLTRSRRAAMGVRYDVYRTLTEINQWMRLMASKYPGRVQLFNITKSYEGRPITAMKIIGETSTESKPGVFFNGGIHAREWLSPAAVVYMAAQLIEGYGVDPSITEVVDAYDWYVLPVFNVDGYVYSWEEDRLWRKTRSRTDHSRCVGVDPNRNWDWKWCTVGSSRDPCSVRYCGPSAFSEVEVREVADFLKAVPGRFRIYVDFHAFSQVWLLPWGHNGQFPGNFISQNKCAKAATAAIKAVHGTHYRYGNLATVLYRISGGSSDWVHGAARIPHSASVELRDTGDYGFFVPQSQIIATGEETLRGLIAMAKCAM